MAGGHQSKASKKTRGKWWRILLVVVILAAVFSFTTVSYPSVAHAGTNGQQIQFSCGMTYGVAKGYNQYGNFVTWQGSVQNYPPPSLIQYFLTSNWWWVGDARIYWYSKGGWKSMAVNVPKIQPGDIAYYSC